MTNWPTDTIGRFVDDRISDSESLDDFFNREYLCQWYGADLVGKTGLTRGPFIMYEDFNARQVRQWCEANAPESYVESYRRVQAALLAQFNASWPWERKPIALAPHAVSIKVMCNGSRKSMRLYHNGSQELTVDVVAPIVKNYFEALFDVEQLAVYIDGEWHKLVT